MTAPVVPIVEGEMVYRSEYTYQAAAPSSFRRAIRKMFDAYPPRQDSVLREREALRLVHAVRPRIRTRRQLFQATAWQPFKWVFGAGQVRYMREPLLAWANARAS